MPQITAGTQTMQIQPDTLEQLTSAAARESLPRHYVEQFVSCVLPAFEENLLSHCFSRPQIIGVQGCQGSGKSTLSEFLKIYVESAHAQQVEICSLDDFYLTRHERRELSKIVHPLFATRGVPGTHDVELILQLFDDVAAGRCFGAPLFEKLNDDRAAEDSWPRWTSSPPILIFEGWCVGIPAQAEDQLLTPVNALEELEDSDLIWRRYVNRKLQGDYKIINDRLDSLLVLQAPSFDCVFEWRRKQEQGMAAKLIEQGISSPNAMDADDLQRFISHYQRLTEHGLNTLPGFADATLYLNPDHSFNRIESR